MQRAGRRCKVQSEAEEECGNQTGFDVDRPQEGFWLKKKKKNHPKRNGKCAHIGRGLQEATSLERHFENVTEAAK